MKNKYKFVFIFFINVFSSGIINLNIEIHLSESKLTIAHEIRKSI